MMAPWLIRLLALGIIISLKIALPFEQFEYLILSAILAHYALGLIYSRGKIFRQAATPLGAANLSFLSVLGYFVARFQVPSTAVCFSFHHTLSETYTSSPDGRATSLPRFLFNWFTYVALLNHLPAFSWMPAELVLGAVVILFVVTAYSLARARAFGLIAFDALGLAMVILIPTGYARLEEVSFYHIAYWAIFPAVGLARKPGALSRYVWATLLATLGFWLLTPAAGLVRGNLPSWIYWINFFGSVHIVLSFALSRWQPAWLNRWVEFLVGWRGLASEA